MKIDNKHYRTIWLDENNRQIIRIIDQSVLPFQFKIENLTNVSEVAEAISEMKVRGAGLIGATGGYGMYLAVLEASKSNHFNSALQRLADILLKTRPTAVNLRWAIARQLNEIQHAESVCEKIDAALKTAGLIAGEDAEFCKKIGEHGVGILEKLSKKKGGDTLNILTHCNAGWLAFVDYGTAISPIYEAFERGIKIHVWVDETRPRNQGARLTAWELGQQGVPHSVIVDNAGGHLMQHAMVDMVIVGSDRATCTGDVANKIGTYLKALAARDNNIPFYAALPSSTFDWELEDGISQIPIEERGGDEVKFVEGEVDGRIEKIMIMPKGSRAINFGFDVTPARLVTGLITERGICKANKDDILRLFPEKALKNG